ncbi:MAG TPA: tripartite tricarboxylate transporter substrate binding protein [Pseudolabrys sp.]|jgi:tripartite-type tricarboxylate transporter receptor subunit TctC|nr:tripartite tricarboxylate transporter substrate binding protein [Pseudolabrys sp.]
MGRIALLLLLTLFYAGAAHAQDDWPNRPIRALTTTSPGGISDVFMRVLGEELRKRLGQTIVVENRPGGMQNVGARACTEAKPDGYTICIINADPVVYNPLLLKNIGFNPETGLQPVTNLFHLIQVLVINANLKANTVDELVELSKKQPGTLSYLTAAPPLALYMETLKKEKGADWVRVPFKGGGEAVNAVLGGSTPIALIGEGNVIGQINAGKMRELVMVNNIHSPLFPKVPTLEETGYKGPPSHTWYGLFVPHGTPKPIVDRLAKEIAAVVADPAFTKKNITDRSLVPDVRGPEAFAKQIEEDRAIARQVVKEAGLTPQ